ncbi:hypothetical protein RS130_16980 [Paraglaciecola aquimarina]|uniref:Lipoprotein n=1 Tax=Paraglaciecola aquimarina TaxID=1235557 RepID=A0ABU3SZF4_9ALTE|nr:hypothetical protein [Paraglaciecola aquimarina]MDU0355373.1 hypothetical protein [Paraglaciecola aquimarina]
MRLSRMVFLSLLPVIMGGCDNQKQLPYLVADYQERLANILDTAPPTFQHVSLPLPSANGFAPEYKRHEH